ncbi:hypothetical protein ACFQ1S_15975 [Kibdelosporangium lantanae]|uniref:Serine/threonine protein kinase n=1 Tax=Kibdelosporangium lantanae TaxID=1497396 RepID=A0ABW3MAC3_9PSEU
MSENPEDQVLRVQITAAEAARGTTVKIHVPNPAGARELTIRIPAATPNNALLRLAGQGPNGTDIYVRVVIATSTQKQAPVPRQSVPAWFPIGFVAAIVVAIIVFTQSHDNNRPSSVASSSTSTSTTSSYTPSTSYSPYSYSYTPSSTTTTYSTPTSESEQVEAAPEDSVGVGGCLQNNGTATSPKMEPATCKSGTFKVLARKTGTTFGSIACNGVARTTHDYTVEKYTVYYRNGIETSRIPNISESYVLCLRQL